MAIRRYPNNQKFPLDIVGSSTFGRDPKISSARTYNMFESDKALVNYAGYLAVNSNSLGTNGRGVYTSNILNRMIAVYGNIVYSIEVTYNLHAINPYLFSFSSIGNLQTFMADVYITENNSGQILISDQTNLYIYQPSVSANITMVTTDFTPGYVDFHNGYFLSSATSDVDGNTNRWRISNFENGNTWQNTSQFAGTLTSKPDNCVAVVRIPSGGNTIFVFGENVVESWFFNQNAQLFPYEKNTSFNVDYGVINASTIAKSDTFVCWLAQNEKSGPSIMYSSGGLPTRISTDGIDYLLANLQFPNSAEAFMYRQDGHLFYHINFIQDNISFYYDFNTDKFYNAVDENNDYFIAHEVAYFENQYYFVSRKDGNFYAFDTIYPSFNGALAPRIRVCSPIRDVNQSNTVKTDLGFTIKQGSDNPLPHTFTNHTADTPPVYPRVDMSFSTDGGESFTSYQAYELNRLGIRPNMLRWWQLGMSNDFTAQFRFYGLNNFYVMDGSVNCTGVEEM